MDYDYMKKKQEYRGLLMTKLLKAIETPSALDIDKLKSELRAEGMEFHARLLEK